MEGSIPFVVTGLLAGLLYNSLFYPRTLVEYLEAGTIGFILGAALGIAEQTSFRRWIQSLSVAQAMLARTFGYSLAVALALALVLGIEPAVAGTCSYLGCVGTYVAGPLFLRDLTFSTLLIGMSALTAQVVLLVGTRNFARLLSGRYQRPRELDATFMFVDLRGSTALAERLGHDRYSALLRDFFDDMAHAVHASRGEVYQYVGDEVVVVWPTRAGADRWLSCFRRMQSAVSAAAGTYMERYGTIPEFKAGVHAGAVIVTEVGALQRAHVYHGDVLNTAARIQAECNAAGFDLLASEAALRSLPERGGGEWASLGQVELRGKAEAVAVFGHTESPRKGAPAAELEAAGC